MWLYREHALHPPNTMPHMTIIFNNNPIQLAPSVNTVKALVAHKELPASGIAVALNNRVVPKARWGVTELKDNDKVTVITAVCGG